MAEQINQIIITEHFAKWLKKLKNPIAKAAVARRIKSAEKGNFGDHKNLSGTDGLFEMRIDTGKGYRIYYAQQGKVIYILLYGGDKSTQQLDIEKATALWSELKQGE
ncbi:type II toxin-antitoxin system RelE/ParE family toxin [Haemophilus haemoglobinophilus]|nr:type II toxin-antitoxin system RelE/ParE family toxin [Canicola haemoglobinophilus]